MTDVALAPTAAAAALMVLAGAPKVVRPLPVIRSLRTMGAPASVSHDALATLVRVGAAVETLAGLAFLVHPASWSALLVAAAYLGFTGFVVAALRRPGAVLTSCGCFGKADTPPTRTHAAVTALFALAALAEAVTGSTGWMMAAGELTLITGAALLIAFLGWQILAVLPTLSPIAVRSVAATPRSHS